MTGPSCLASAPKTCCRSDGNGEAVFANGAIRSVEHLGHETLLHAEIAGQSCVARLPGWLPAAGVSDEHQPLTIRPGGERLFTADDAGSLIR